MSAGEVTIIRPIFMIGMIVTFMMVIPWVQSRRFTRWKMGEGIEQKSLNFLFRASGGRHFHPLDLVGVLLILGIFASSLWIPTPPPSQVQPISLENLQTNMVFQAVLSLMVLARMLYCEGSVNQALGLRPKSLVLVLALAPVAVVLTWVFTLAIFHFGWNSWVETVAGGQVQEVVQRLLKSEDLELKMWLIFSAVIVAPICEELIFRGFVFGVLRDLSNPGFAAIVSGIFFGVVHSNLMSLPSLCFLGILLAVIYHLTRSIWAPIMCHFLFNLATVLLQTVAPLD